jgi:phenylacetate-CoA ligase
MTPNGGRLIVHFFTGIMEYAHTIETFQVIQEAKDEIIMRLVPKTDFKMTDWEILQREIIEKAGDPDLKIKMEIVSSDSLGHTDKRRFVISKINPELGSIKT